MARLSGLIAYAARVAVRRVVYIIVAAIVALAFGTSRAEAKEFSTPQLQAAWDQCESEKTRLTANYNSNGNHWEGYCAVEGPSEQGLMCVYLYEKYWVGDTAPSGYSKIGQGCAMGVELQECEEGGDTHFGWATAGASGACKNGCAYRPDDDIMVEMGGKLYGNYTQTGERCPAGDTSPPTTPDEDEEACDQTVMGQEVCGEPDGDVCVKMESGRTACVNIHKQECDQTSGDALCVDPKVPDEGPDDDYEEEDNEDDICVKASEDGEWNMQDVVCADLTAYENEGSGEDDGDEDDDGVDDDDDDNEGDGDNDDGDGDEETRTATLTGCEAEPVCSGDDIDCAHYKTTWRFRCDAHGKKTSGGASCASPPVCEKDPIGCAQLSQMWRLRCDSDAKITESTSCSREPSCTGDAIGCAAAREEHRLRCMLDGTVTMGDPGTTAGCSKPPACTGSDVMCAQLKQTWAQTCALTANRTATDSGNCTAPPTCSGDKIACANMKTQWALQCDALAKTTTITGGTTCASPPVCSNPDSAQCALVKNSWHERCDEATGEEDNEGGDDDEEEEGPPPDTTPGASGMFVDAPVPADFLDDAGLGWGRMCPLETGFDITAIGATIHIETGQMCDFMRIGAALVMLFAYLTAARIMWGSR